MKELPPGTFTVGNRLYTRCQDCLKFVRVTGWFAGWHLCLTPEELAAKRGLPQTAKESK